MPHLAIPKRSWLTIWHSREAADLKKSARIFFIVSALLYAAHIPLHLYPKTWDQIEFWMTNRITCTLLHLFGVALTYRKDTPSWLLKSYIILAYSVCIAFQAEQMHVKQGIPFFYIPLLALLGTLATRSSPALSLPIYFILSAAGFRGVQATIDNPMHVISVNLVCITFLLYLRNRQRLDVTLFIAEQTNLEGQRLLIETQQSLIDQIRSFLPKEIYRRVESVMACTQTSALAALDEVLTPRERICAVLYSDIRGFTDLSKQGNNVVTTAIVPAQKLCAEAVERYTGIPRMHGDLVFSFFDSNDPIANIRHAMLAAIEICESTTKLNRRTIGPEIRRYGIVSFGPMLVGNIGGTEGSRDITVLGPEANLPSRIDEVVRDSKFQELVANNNIILSQNAVNALAAFPDVTSAIEAIPLSELGFKLRNFPELDTIYSVAVTSSLKRVLMKPVLSAELPQQSVSLPDKKRFAA